jgi:hypothetical protein
MIGHRVRILTKPFVHKDMNFWFVRWTESSPITCTRSTSRYRFFETWDQAIRLALSLKFFGGL